MADTEVEALVAHDDVETSLYTYGLSGEPVRWAPSTWQPVVNALRQANLGVIPVSAVQPLLDADFPDGGYQATDMCLAHPPVGDFTVTTAANSVRVDLAGDVDLGLPDENVEWSFGDGTKVRDAGGYDHEYREVGTYEIRVEVLVAGAVFGSSQTVEISTTADPIPTEAEGFDPADHTVDEVLAYVDEHPDELEAVLDAEEAGKQRVTLINKLTTE